MSCVVSRCGSELQECVKDPTCLRGLGCFVSCATHPPPRTDGKLVTPCEGACQVRCVDLYESDTLNAFTRCTLTENACYPALPADPRYPPLPSHLAETVDEAHLRHLLQGRWYVSAGLNPAFDCFACQIHDFTAVSETEELPNGKAATIPIADATFSYRVKIDSKTNKCVTRVGKKRLYLKKDGGSDATAASSVSFRRGMAWGRDAFDRPSTSRNQKNSGAQLALTTVPDYMDYEDEWTILSASSIDDTVVHRVGPDSHGTAIGGIARSAVGAAPSSSSSSTPHPTTDYMVVAYRGSNAAWRGYGGLNVYTRQPLCLRELMETKEPQDGGDEALLRGIQRGLDKVGLALSDLLPVDLASDGCGSRDDTPGATS